MGVNLSKMAIGRGQSSKPRLAAPRPLLNTPPILTMKTLQHLTRLIALLAIVSIGSTASYADRVDDLAKRLHKSDSDKARIAAAVSLGRLKDKRALKPLVKALNDDNVVVRSVAAAGLGSLGDSRALPALRRASLDKNKTVRKRATEAIGVIRKSSSATAGRRNDRYMVKSRTIRAAHYRVDGRESPRLSPRKPDLFVSVRTAADKSKGKSSKKARKEREGRLKRLMQTELKGSKRLTTIASVAEDLALPVYAVDLSITRLKRIVNGPWIEVECELRIAISNERGKMISFLTGGAKVQVPKRAFRKQYEPNMRREALENAVNSVHQDLVRYLLKTTGA